MKNDKPLYKLIYKTFPAILFVFTIQTICLPETAAAQNSPQSKIEEAKRNDFFGAMFREGRNLIDKGEWAQASEKFRAALDKNPEHKLADAALYWLAFCYKKQKRFEEADAALDRLLGSFPASSWAGDARVMKMEIAPLLGIFNDSRNAGNNPDSRPRGLYSADALANVVSEGTLSSKPNPVEKKASADLLRSGDRAPLEREDEIKLAAFQSLLNADPKRAVAVTGDIFKPDSKASESLKQAILSVWRNPRLFASKALLANIIKTVGEQEFATLLRETLAGSFQHETNPKLRKEIIYTLASYPDGQTIDYLKKLYAAENDREIKKAIINSFGNSANFFSSADQKQLARFDAAREERRKTGRDFLLGIVRADKDSELRRLAFSHLSRFRDWSESETGVDTMVSLYDAEADEQFKLTIIRAFAESKQNKATGKLLDIAKNDKSDKLRLEAIYSLRTSKDPEVLKFLEDLIK